MKHPYRHLKMLFAWARNHPDQVVLCVVLAVAKPFAADLAALFFRHWFGV